MYQNSNALPFRTIESPALQLQPTTVRRDVPLLFLACAVALSVFAFMEPLKYSWYRPSYDESEDAERSEVGAREGSVQRQITLGAMGLFGIAALAWPSDKQLRFRGTLGLVCIAYLTWCAASILWTDNLSMSLRRIIALGCEVLAATAIALRASPRQFAWFVFACTLTWLGLGIIAEMTQGALQPWQAGYRFKGIFHPNIMSANCALLIMASLYLGDGAQVTKRILQAVAGTAFVFLVLTGSRTAIGAILVSYAAVLMFTTSMPKKFLLVGLVGLAFAVIAIAAGFGAFDLSADWVAMGRQDHDLTSLTARVPLWHELLNVYVPQRPLEGYGYGAFWTPAHITDVEKTQGWNAPYAHSTYIDLLLSVGFIGTLLFLSAMVVAFVRAARLEARHARAGYGFIAMVIACVLADGALETTFGSTWFMSFFGICAVCYLLTFDRKSRQMSYATANL